MYVLFLLNLFVYCYWGFFWVFFFFMGGGRGCFVCVFYVYCFCVFAPFLLFFSS